MRRSLRVCAGGAVAAAGIAVAACAGWEPFDPPVQRDIPEGPGLFSGSDGEFAVEVEVAPAEEEEEKTEEQPEQTPTP
jgi:hypothetical protein